VKVHGDLAGFIYKLLLPFVFNREPKALIDEQMLRSLVISPMY
jgi:hypothetical protein